jgi:hypothetical protein
LMFSVKWGAFQQYWLIFNVKWAVFQQYWLMFRQVSSISTILIDV